MSGGLSEGSQSGRRQARTQNASLIQSNASVMCGPIMAYGSAGSDCAGVQGVADLTCPYTPLNWRLIPLALGLSRENAYSAERSADFGIRHSTFTVVVLAG